MTALYYMYYSFESQCYFSNPNDLSDVLESGAFQDIALKGVTPTMNYKEGIIDGFIAPCGKDSIWIIQNLMLSVLLGYCT